MEFAYKSASKPTWCPGCGDFGVLNAVYASLRNKGYNPKDVVCVSGIGCARQPVPFFVTSYGFHGLHGRAMTVSTGVKAARPELTVLTLGGDGDAFAIGGNHFIHAARRNLDITYVVMDNATYGLTKGQASPTSRLGYITKTTPQGSQDQSLNPLALALVGGATFIARGLPGSQGIGRLDYSGYRAQGFLICPCSIVPAPTFNKIDTFKYYKEEIADMPADHDCTDMNVAFALAMKTDQIHVGVLYKREAPLLPTGMPPWPRRRAARRCWTSSSRALAERGSVRSFLCRISLDAGMAVR